MSDKELTITRVFDAPVETVWKAWTDPEMVKKWWGPKDFTAPSIKIDFTVGGKYIYCMHGPKGSEWDKDMYSAGIYKEIVPMEKIVVTDYFSDENGNKIDPTEMGMGADVPEEMNATVMFEDVANNKAKLTIIYTFISEADYNAMIKTGIQEGWSTSLDKFAESLK